MAAASLDVNFKEELSAIEQCSYLIPLYVPLSVLILILCRVQSSLRSRAHSRSLQSSSTFYPGSNQILYHRPSADGKIGSDDRSPQPRHGR
jgi:hypothetical protein